MSKDTDLAPSSDNRSRIAACTVRGHGHTPTACKLAASIFTKTTLPVGERLSKLKRNSSSLLSIGLKIPKPAAVRINAAKTAVTTQFLLSRSPTGNVVFVNIDAA